MQWRSARVWPVLVSTLAAIVMAGCTSEEVVTGPRIASLAVISGNTQTGPIGGLLPAPLVVRVVDQQDEPIAGAVVTFAVTAGGGTTSPGSDTTDADGYAQTTHRLGSEIGVQTVEASLPGLAPVAFTQNATSAPASKLTVDGGDTQTGRVGSQLTTQLTVKVTDAFGNPKAGIPVSFVVVTGGGALNANVVLSDADGLSNVRWTLGTAAGTQSVSASAGALAPATFTATATPDLPAEIVVLSGGNQTAAPGAQLNDSIVVKMVDQYGNGVSGVTIDWVAAQGNGSASPTSSVTNATGRTATKWTIGTKGGPMTLTARSGTIQTPVGGAAFIGFATVTAGGRSSCGIDAGGVLYCWGFNGDGQLGIGTGPAGSGPIYAAPQALAPVTNQTFASINGGMFHNCAVTFSHVGYCWGDNNNGQVGVGSNNRSTNEPSSIDVSIPFLSISAGRVHSCGISIGGRGYCWGSNERGQLGASVAFDTTTVPGTTLVTFHDTNKPVELGSPFGSGTYFFGPWDWSAIAAGGVHTCAVRQGGNAYCWGLGREGQLGNGTNSVDEYRPQLVISATAFDSIAAGYKHSCGRSPTGAVSCWGDNTDGQLGSGAAASSNVPVNVSGGLSFLAISTGYAHTCGIAADRTAYCWGKNDRGQLGDGSTTGRNAPVAVAGGLTFATLTAGDFHTCGVTTGGTAYCWGDNEYGAVGDGTVINRSSPTKVRFQQ
ncbi:MAG: Ig-like domain-containing protein [Gemmatimonadales bacterium]|nr:Ig-like domain-containing protein [Gemmatimonadales bacterium]